MRIREIRVSKNKKQSIEVRVNIKNEKNIQVHIKYHSSSDINQAEYRSTPNFGISIKRQSFYRSN